jgi:hypothetical protein
MLCQGDMLALLFTSKHFSSCGGLCNSSSPLKEPMEHVILYTLLLVLVMETQRQVSLTWTSVFSQLIQCPRYWQWRDSLTLYWYGTWPFPQHLIPVLVMSCESMRWKCAPCQSSFNPLHDDWLRAQLVPASRVSEFPRFSFRFENKQQMFL